MTPLSTHIEQLLLHHDCVIVPGLGGFVAHDCPAIYIEEEDTFLPPFRGVSFNPRLTMNDGLLVQRVAETGGMSYHEAMTEVKQMVEELRAAIDRDGAVTIGGVGRLKSTTARSYEFTPLLCGIASPRHYGLDSLYAPSLHAAETAAETAVKPQMTSPAADKEEEEETITLKIGMNTLRHAAAVAVATLLYFIVIAPLQTAIHHGTSEAGFFQQITALFAPATTAPALQETEEAAERVEAVPTQTAWHTAPAQTAAEAQAEAAMNTGSGLKGPQPADTVSTASPNAEKADLQGATPLSRKDGYTIVLASAIPPRGAQQMVETLHHLGDGSARVAVRGKMTRVVYGCYETQEDAQMALREMRAANEVFKEAWVMKDDFDER